MCTFSLSVYHPQSDSKREVKSKEKNGKRKIPTVFQTFYKLFHSFEVTLFMVVLCSELFQNLNGFCRWVHVVDTRR